MTAAHTPPPPPPPPPPSSSCYRSPQRTPNNASNNYASTHTPILSAKRPKKWSASPKSTHNVVAASSSATATTPSNSLSSPPTTPEMMGKLKKKLHATTLSPMHNVRPVPRDSHHVPTSNNYCASSSTEITAANAIPASLSTSTSTTKDAADYARLHETRSKMKKHPLTMIEELEVSSSINETTNAADGNDEEEEKQLQEDETAAELTNANNGPSSASWVGRKVDAIFSPVLSFLSGTTTTTTATNATTTAALSTPAEEDDEDDEEGKFLQRSPTTQSSTYLESNSGSYMQENEEEEHANNDITASSSTTISAAALTAARRSSTNSSSSVTTVVDVDGDVTMAENNYKLHYRYEEEEEEEVVVSTTTTTRYHDEESPPTADKYTVSSSRADEEDGGYSNDANNTNTANAEDDEEEEEEFNPYLFIKCLPPYHYAIPPGWISRPKALPPPNYTSHPPTPPICLVLDLDETLVHCTVEAVPDADMVFPVEFHGVEYLVHVRCRPYLREFLEMVHEKFEVVIFTASQQVYADKLLDKIDPEGKFIRHRMFRDSCLPVEGNFLKDLNILGRDLSKAVLVDNSPHAFGYQVDNGIPIESWFDDPTDKELLKLELFLRTLHGVEDVREVVRKTFHTHQLVLEA